MATKFIPIVGWFFDEDNKQHCVACDVDINSIHLVNRRPSKYSPNHDTLTFCTRVSRAHSVAMTATAHTKIPKGDFVVFFEA